MSLDAARQRAFSQTASSGRIHEGLMNKECAEPFIHIHVRFCKRLSICCPSKSTVRGRSSMSIPMFQDCNQMATFPAGHPSYFIHTFCNSTLGGMQGKHGLRREAILSCDMEAESQLSSDRICIRAYWSSCPAKRFNCRGPCLLFDFFLDV